MSATGIRDLGARLASAEESAFRDCYAELDPMLRRYLRGRVPDADIEDVVQVVFVELWRFRSRYDARRSLEAWVLTIARRVEQARDVQAALAQLPSAQREAIELAYFADLTQREIAARLDVPLGTIKTRIARGLRRLAGLAGRD